RGVRGIIIAAVAAFAFFATFRPIFDPDAWFHLKLGEWILATGSFPRVDPFSYTAGDTPYVPSGWLTAVIMALAEKIYPESSLGPILMVTIAAGLAIALVLKRAWYVGSVAMTSLVLLPGLVL